MIQQADEAKVTKTDSTGGLLISQEVVNFDLSWSCNCYIPVIAN